jgi:hypothetical protein
METPESYENVWVTFMQTTRHGPYRSEKRTTKVTKRGFYSDLFGYFSVPPDWREFKGVLLPHGWGGDRVPIAKVLGWTHVNKEIDSALDVDHFT